MAADCQTNELVKGRLIRRISVLCPEAKTEAQLEAEASQILRQAGDTAIFTEVVVSSSARELRRSTMGAAASEYGFDQVREALMRAEMGDPMSPDPILRLLRRGDSTLLTFRKAGRQTIAEPGVVERLISGRADPRIVGRDNSQTRLLHVAEIVPGPMAYRGATLFFRATKPPTCDLCRSLYGEAFKLGLDSFTHVKIRVRDNYWFDGEEFPLTFRFERDDVRSGYLGRFGVRRRLLVVPTVEEYYQGAVGVECWGSEAAVSTVESCAYSGRLDERMLNSPRKAK